MSLFNLWNNPKPTQPAQQPQGQQQSTQQASHGQQGQGQQPGGQGNGSQPGFDPVLNGNGNQQGQQPKPEGLDLFAQMMQNNPAQQGSAPTLAYKPEDLANVAKGQQFSNAISPETLQSAFSQAANGDFSGFQSMLDDFGRQVYMTAMNHSAVATNAYANERFNYERQNTQGDVRRQQLLSSFTTISHLHPSAQDMFRNAAAKVAESMPQASTAEIEAKTWEFMEMFGGQFDRKAYAQRQQQQASEKDWDKEFDR